MLHLSLHLNNLTEGVSSLGPEPVTRNNPQAGCVFLLSLHTCLHPAPSLGCKSKPRAARRAAPQSASGTSGGRKSNLFDCDIICIANAAAITSMIKIKTIISNLLLWEASRAESRDWPQITLAMRDTDKNNKYKKSNLRRYLLCCASREAVSFISGCGSASGVTGQQLGVYSVVMKYVESTQQPALGFLTPLRT